MNNEDTEDGPWEYMRSQYVSSCAPASDAAQSALGLQLNHVEGLRNAYTPPSEYEEYFSIYQREKAEKLRKLLRKDDFGSDERRRACRDAFESKVLLRPAGR